ncbi:MAG: hypothetical protein P8Y02_02690, partial [Deinococcales bacterium]
MMRPVRLRWLLGAQAASALLVLAACSTPAEKPYSKSVSLDGYQTTATLSEQDSTRIADCTSFGSANDVRYTYTLFDTTDGAQDV